MIEEEYQNVLLSKTGIKYHNANYDQYVVKQQTILIKFLEDNTTTVKVIFILSFIKKRFLINDKLRPAHINKLS